MKKICYLIYLLTCSFIVFAETVVTTATDFEVSETSVIKQFVNEINTPRYAYALYDYKVYKTVDEKEEYWSVDIEDCSYIEENHKIIGEQVILNIPNGYFVIKTWGRGTTYNTIAEGEKQSYFLNDDKEASKFYEDFIYALQDFVNECYEYSENLNFSKEELKEVSELCFINYDDYLFNSKMCNYNNFIKQEDGYYRKGDVFIDQEKYIGTPITNKTILNLFEMSDYEYSLENLMDVALYEGRTVPDEYTKYVSYMSCRKAYSASNKREYVFLEFSIYDTKDKDYYKSILVETSMLFNKTTILTDDYAAIISMAVGRDVYIQGVIDSHNYELK